MFYNMPTFLPLLLLLNIFTKGDVQCSTVVNQKCYNPLCMFHCVLNISLVMVGNVNVILLLQF